MATVVLVHGIAQEQLGPASLEKNWLPALADGVAKNGDQALSDRIWRAGVRGEIDIRMAYYGTPFIDEGAQGDGEVDLDSASLPDGAEELALTWLQAAAESASDPVDRRTATDEMKVVADIAGHAQGPLSLGRPVLNALAALRWFAPFGMAVAGRFVWKALTQVGRYLSDDDLRTWAQDQVLAWIDEDTRLVIGHSLGSVVAYEAMHRSQHPAVLITLGSPLGLPGVVYPKLRPQPPRVPTAVRRWENFVAEDDLVAARLDLEPYFAPADGSVVKPVSHVVDTGAKPHQVEHYLTKRSCGNVVAETLALQ